MSKKIVSFYKFKELKNLDKLKNKIFDCLKKHKILGTVILSIEGINVNICGDRLKVDHVCEFMFSYLNFKPDHINEEKIENYAFSKLKVKIKDEIIKIGFNTCNHNTNLNNYLSPDEWDKYIENNSIIIDTRNKFEYLMGTFNNSKNLNLTNFSDFEENFKSLKLLDKRKNYLIFCTGGIRCEKASVVMKNLGYENVFQLKGGILNYLKRRKNKSHWDGECFVFDDRISI